MSKTRSTVLIALLVAVALSGGLLLGLSGGGGGRAAPASAPAPAPTGSPSPTTTDAPAPLPERIVVVQPVGQPVPQPAPQPAPQPEPQPQPKPNPGVLAVGPSVIDLPANTWAAKFTVANLGGSDLAWFAVGVPSTLSLSATQGVLKPGEDVTIGVTVDHTKLAKGDFSLTLHISANDTAQSVTIKGTKTIKPIGPVGPGTLTAKE